MQEDDFFLSSEQDILILMHREAHFGGSFSAMIDYYEKGGKGASEECNLPRIKELASLEEMSGENFAAILLSGGEAEKVQRIRESYLKLRTLYEEKAPHSYYPKLIANLILSEEEEPQEEIAAIVAQGKAIIPALHEVLQSEDLYDPLFPGYGKAPFLAARCLGKIGDKRAVILLFQMIGEGSLVDEEAALKALKEIGAPAKDFLLKVVKGRPFNRDNEQAAIALLHFKEDPEVATTSLGLLLQDEVRNHQLLASYLALTCEGLPKGERHHFIALGKDSHLPKSFRQEISALAGEWGWVAR